jgi:hypothetical protein
MPGNRCVELYTAGLRTNRFIHEFIGIIYLPRSTSSFEIYLNSVMP